MIWPMAFALFLITAIMYASKSRFWWLFAIIAAMTSQILIIFFWSDAKYGTILNVIIFIASIIGFGAWSYYNKFQNDVKKDYHEINGYKQMGNAEAIYRYPDRDLVYGTFKLIRIEYNCKDID
jgi:hypothetical protein